MSIEGSSPAEPTKFDPPRNLAPAVDMFRSVLNQTIGFGSTTYQDLFLAPQSGIEPGDNTINENLLTEHAFQGAMQDFADMPIPPFQGISGNPSAINVFVQNTFLTLQATARTFSDLCTLTQSGKIPMATALKIMDNLSQGLANDGDANCPGFMYFATVGLTADYSGSQELYADTNGPLAELDSPPTYPATKTSDTIWQDTLNSVKAVQSDVTAWRGGNQSGVDPRYAGPTQLVEALMDSQNTLENDTSVDKNDPGVISLFNDMYASSYYSINCAAGDNSF